MHIRLFLYTHIFIYIYTYWIKENVKTADAGPSTPVGVYMVMSGMHWVERYTEKQRE